MPRRGLPPGLLPLLFVLAGAVFASSSPAPSEPLRWLVEYLRIDTSNPPGDEHRAAAFLRGVLHGEGVATRLLVSPEGRASLYARLDSGREAGALVLQHHMDVVPAEDGWSADPFGGEIGDGFVWGRGAIDAKSLGIAHLAAFLDLKRRGAALARDVVFLAVADEEAGGRGGTGWLLERHPELFEGVAAVLGEGGSNRGGGGRLGWWGVEVAQKRPLWLRVTAYGRGGHGSSLNLHTAPHRLVRALGRLVDRPLAFRITPEARAYFEAAAPLQGGRFREVVESLEEIVASESPERRLLPGLPNYLLDSVQVNAIAAGARINVAPAEAEALVDVRLLPDTDQEAFLAGLRETLGERIRVEVLLDSPPVAPSSTDGEIYRCLERALASSAPVVPAFIPGVTDARYFRQRGIAAYGFSPFVIDGPDLAGIHGADERIPVAAFERGVETMIRVTRACAGG